jgi:branched-chain amino acid transport system substrate-binding protein
VSKSSKVVRRRAPAIAGLVGIAVLASACSSSSKAASTASASSVPPAATTSASAPAASTGASTPSAAAAGSAVASATGTPIKIGADFSLTGPIAAIAAQELAGVKLAVQAVNAAGGAAGHPLQLDITDDAYAPDQAVLNIRKLAGENVAAIVGPGSSNSTVAGGQAANSLQVPLVALPSTVGTIWDGSGTLKWAFGTAGDGGALGQGCYNSFLNVEKAAGKTVKKIAIGQEQSPGPLSYAVAVQKTATAAGATVSSSQTWGGDVTDLTTQISTLLKSNPDAIILSTQTQTNILALKALDQLGALGTIPVVDCSAVDIASWQKAVGALAEKPNLYLMALADDVYPGVKTGDPNDAQRQAVDDAFAKYPSVAGVPAISNFTGSGWDSVQLIVNAIELKGTTRAEIRDGLEQGKPYDGATATDAYGPTQHRATYDDYAKVARLVDFPSGKPALAGS